MKNIAVRLRARAAADTGFSLIEVVVAIVILGILSTATLGIYLASMNTASTQQRREIAITIANQQMEVVNSWSTEPNVATGTNDLYIGRSQAAVVASWATNTRVPGVAQTYPVWDKRATPPAEAIPIKPAVPVRITGTDYTVETLLGTCFQPKRTGGNCTRVTGFVGYPTAPSPAMLSNYTPLTRVIVIVRWTSGSACSSGDCSYVTSTLIDLNGDLNWNTHD